MPLSKIRLACHVTATIGLATASAGAAPAKYTLLPLGTLGGDATVPKSINGRAAAGGVVEVSVAGRLLGVDRRGDMVGCTAVSRDGRAVMAPFLRRVDGSTATLTTLGGSSCARAINEAGHIVGAFMISPTAEDHLLFWTGSSSYVDAGRFGPGFRWGVDINGSGRWIAQFQPAGGHETGYTQAGDGPLEPLALMPGAARSLVSAINDSNVIIGSTDIGGRFVETLWHIGLSGTEIVNLSQRVVGYAELRFHAHAISEEGQITVEYDAGGRRSNGGVLTPVRLELATTGRPVVARPHAFTVRNCEPGARVRILRGPRRAATPYAHGATGARFDLEDVVTTSTEGVADAAGNATVSATFPTAGPALVQAVHRGNKSAVVALEVDALPPVVVTTVNLPQGATRPLPPAASIVPAPVVPLSRP